MFHFESGFLEHKEKHGQREAVELIADINEYSHLQSPKDKPKKRSPDSGPSLNLQRTLLDYNEHFIELSNIGEEDRSLMLIVSGLLLSTIFLSLWMWSMGFSEPPFTESWYWGMVIGFCATGFAIWFNFMMWPLHYAPNYFTYLRPRYRFNRTTRKVYVLRPPRYGGNVVLDWDRLLAHVSWCAPLDMTHDDLRDPMARRLRQASQGGNFMFCCLLLYWPPFDKNDKERKGEDVIWIGPRLSGENLWQYIRTFMEEGIDKVPVPTEYEWLRKGFHSPGEHHEETVLGPSRVLDEVGGRAAPGKTSLLTDLTSGLYFLWAPLHSLSERLCYWPKFPEEWNSDCGQKRREDGIGPEEPLRWTAK